MDFIDFCAGIGGGRLGLTKSNLNCVAFSEIDKNAENTYRKLYGDNEVNYGDVTKIDPKDLPNFDLMIAGFPCQTFSIVGKREGFNDKRGLIIYSLIDILKSKETPFFIMENVKGLTNHNGGETFAAIKTALTNAGYNVYCKVLNSINYGIPHMRERVYIVGIRKDIKCDFKWPDPIECGQIKDYLCDGNADVLPLDDTTFNRYLNNKYNRGNYNIKEILEEDYLVLDTRQSDLRIYRGKVPTLRTGRHGILYVKNGQLHKITGYEGLLLQGFPKNVADVAKAEKINNNTLLSQAGNAMTVNVINAISTELLKAVGGKIGAELN